MPLYASWRHNGLLPLNTATDRIEAELGRDNPVGRWGTRWRRWSNAR